MGEQTQPQQGRWLPNAGEDVKGEFSPFALVEKTRGAGKATDKAGESAKASPRRSDQENPYKGEAAPKLAALVWKDRGFVVLLIMCERC